MPGICPTAFGTALASMAGDVEFHVNSPGGDVSAMNMMLSSVMEWRKKDANAVAEARITGIAASAAVSLLTTSRRCRVTAMPQAALMVHEPALAGMTAKALRQFAEMLDDDTETLVDQYAAARGLDRDAVMAEVREETWMSARRARRTGWIDQVYPVVEDAEDSEGEAAGETEAEPEEEPAETASGAGSIRTDATDPATDPTGEGTGRENQAAEKDDSQEAPAGDAAGEDTNDRGSRSLLRRVRRRRR